MNYKDNLKVREAHYIKQFGELSKPIMHSTDDVFPHIDIYQFKPSDERPYWTLITGGMSDERMCIPDNVRGEIGSRAEILTYVEEPKIWMFNVLKSLAEMPIRDKTYLHWQHTVPNGMPMTADRSLLTDFYFLTPYSEGEDFDSLEINEDLVDILWMIPITSSELQYKLKYGGKALEDLFEKHELNPVIEEQRSSLI